MAVDPIPCRKHLKRCGCGKRPRVGTTLTNIHRVGCMQLLDSKGRPYGCGKSTDYHGTIKKAEDDWNENYGG